MGSFTSPARLVREHRLSSTLTLLLSIATLVLGNCLQGSLVSVRAGLEGMGPFGIGLLMCAYFSGYAGGSWLCPHLLRDVGHIRTFAAFATITSAAALGYILDVSPSFWLLLRVIQGVCYAGLVIVAESWLNGTTDRRHRGRLLSSYWMVILLSWAVSQQLLNLGPPSGAVLFCLVSIFFSLSLLPVTMSRAAAPAAFAPSRLQLRQLYRSSPLGVLGTLAVGSCLGAFLGIGPSFARHTGLTAGQLAGFLTMMPLGALVAQWPLGWLSDMVDRRWVILLASLLGATVSFRLALGGGGGDAVLLLAFLFGAFSLPAYSLCVAHANDRLAPEEMVAAASTLILVYGAGAAIGPVLAGALAGRFGSGGLFLFTGTVQVLLVLFGSHRFLKRETLVIKKKFVAVPHLAHVLLHFPGHRFLGGKEGGKTRK